jgi:hypothetical protein
MFIVELLRGLAFLKGNASLLNKTWSTEKYEWTHE